MSLPTIENLLQNALGLVYPLNSGGEAEYLFRHTLVQETLYDSLLRTDRQRLHQAAGEALEQMAGMQAGDAASPAFPEAVLAYHFDKAGNTLQALRYYSLAGDAAARVYALPEAIGHYQRALQTGGSAVDDERLQHLCLSLGRALELSGEYFGALAVYQALESAGQERQAQALELAAVMAITTLHATPTPLRDEQRVQALSQRALALARQAGDHAAEAKILWNMMLVASTAGDAELGVQYGELSLQIARTYGLREQTAFTLNDMQFCLIGTGQFERAIRGLEEARTLWLELDNLPMRADNLARLGLIYLLTGRYAAGEAAIAESYAISRSIDNLWGMSFSRMIIGQLYQYRGEPGRALLTNREVVELSQRGGSVVPQISTRIELAWMYALQGDLETAQMLAGQARAAAQRYIPSWEPLVDAWQARIDVRSGALERARAIIERLEATQTHKDAYSRLQMVYILPLAGVEYRLAVGRVRDAVELIERALVMLRASGIRPYTAELQLLQARALLELGQDALASAALDEALAEIDRMGGDDLRWRGLLLQARIALRCGSPETAARLRQEARALVLQIAERCLPELRPAYLAQAEIQAVLQD